MSLDSGEITHQDLSPNANIQGTQIADKTLALRNLSDDTFGIIKVVNSTFPTVTVSGSTGNWGFGNATTTIAHGLSITPIPFGTFFDGTTYIQLPDTKLNGGGTTPIWNEWRVRVDATNIYLDLYVTVFNYATGFDYVTPAYPAKIYLLQETAN